MRGNIICMLALAVLLCGCANRDKGKENLLAYADNVVEDYPDSALSILCEVDTTTLNEEADRAVYYLLLNQAQYKLYKPTQAEDSLNSCIDYFSKSGDNHNLCRSYFYRGATLEQRGLYEEALDYLKKGEILAKGQGDYWLSKYYNLIYVLYIESNNNILALRYAKLALAKAQSLKNYSNIANCYSNMNIIYDRLGFRDSAKMFIQKDISMLDKVKETELPYILNNIGSMYAKCGERDSAKLYLQKALSKKALHETFSTLADIYMLEENYDSALVMLDSASHSEKIVVRRNVMDKYSECYKRMGLLSKSIAYSALAKQLSDTINNQSKIERMADINFKYDLATEEDQPFVSYFWLAIFVPILAVFYITVRRISKKNEEIRKRNNIIDGKDKELKAKESMIETIVKSEKRVEDELKMLYKQLEKEKKDRKKYKQDVIENISIGKVYYDDVMQGKPLPIDDKDAKKWLVEYFAASFQEKYNSWTQQYGKLSYSEAAFMVLNDMGYPDNKIAVLLSVTDGAIRNVRYRLNKRTK